MRNVSLGTFAIALTAALLPLLSSCAASPDTQAAKGEVRLTHAADLLRDRTDADSLAAAGLFNAVRHPDQSLRLIAEATAAAPERADLVWLQIQMCQAEPTCDPEPVERRLRSLDASNGAGWMGALIRANRANDDPAKSAALAAMGRSERVDVYWTTLIARLSRATANTKALSLTEAEIDVIGILSARAIPEYHVLSKACDAERLARAHGVEVCRGIATALMHGDTYITELMGVAIAKRLWPEGSPEWIEAAEARRSFDYRMTFSSHTEAWNAAHTDAFLILCADHRREQDVFQAELIAIGKNPDPSPN
jgi:hypothetical protein